MKEMKEILKDAGATETQIEWGINLPNFPGEKKKECVNWRQNLRMCLLR